MHLVYALVALVSMTGALIAAAPIQLVRRSIENSEIAVTNAEVRPAAKSLAKPPRKYIPTHFRSFTERHLRKRASEKKKSPKIKKKPKAKNDDPEESGDDDPDSGDVDESGEDDETDESGRDDVDDDTNSGDTDSGDTDGPDDEAGPDGNDENEGSKGEWKGKRKSLKSRRKGRDIISCDEPGVDNVSENRTGAGHDHDDGNDGDNEDED